MRSTTSSIATESRATTIAMLSAEACVSYASGSSPMLRGMPFAVVWLQSRSEGPHPLVMLALATGGVLAVVFVLKRRTRLRFTDQGICFVGLIKRGEIRSYRWDKNPEGGEELELDISMKGRNSTISYPIPAIYRERVAEILVARVPRAS